MNLREIIKSLPYPVKQSLKYIYGTLPPTLRYGRVFWDTYNFLQESQWWSREKLEEYQMQQLTKLLHHAYKNVPYYQRIFNECGLKPEDFQDFNDLKKMPYLTKDEFKKNFKELVATNTNLRNLTRIKTSGTSGKPLQFYTTDNIEQKEWAFVCHQWSRVGYKPGDLRVEIRGQIKEENDLVEFNPFSKVLKLSPRIANKETAKYYLRKITKFKANYLHGYPSAIASFAHIIKKYGLIVPFNLKAVLFASEAVYNREREIVKDVFNCRVFSLYGLAERVVIAAECEKSQWYHCLPQYGITELDPETNEIIGTGFLNYINPFIRYKTGDIAFNIKHNSDCCDRGYYPIFENVEGRIGDFIYTSRGLLGPALISLTFKDIKTIRETQIIQKSIDYIVIRIVPWDKKDKSYSKAEVKQLCQNFQKLLGDDIRIEIEKVEEIKRTKSGKFKWIISEVSRESMKKDLIDL